MIVYDSIPGFVGTIDTLAPAFAPKFSGSSDGLEDPVDYAAQDSMITDMVAEEVHLYNQATVTYGAVKLVAGHIVLNYATNIVTAEAWPDSSGTLAGKPQFTDGGQTFDAGRMVYNFKSGKGIVYETVTTQDDILIRGGKSKFVTGGVQVNDTTRADVVYSEGAIFTTCTADHPHFGIRTRKAKVIPNKLAVIGPSNLEIMGVPTPLWLPFGFFPLKSGRSSGLLFPSDYQYREVWGFGLEGIGWFFPLGEHFNLSATADIYVNGTFRANAGGSYRKRYNYSGTYALNYSRLVREDGELNPVIDKGVSLKWSHRMDPKAHPTLTFGGTINFQTNQVDQRFQSDYATASTNVIRSGMNLTKQFTKLKSTLTAGFNHSQNNNQGVITINFPDARFQTQTIYPFRNLDGGTPKSWWKKLSLRYRSALRTEFTASDTSLFTQQTFDQGQYGFEHSVTSAVSLNVLKYFNVSPNVSLNQVLYGKRFSYGLDESAITIDDTSVDPVTGQPIIDTTSFATIVRSLDPGLTSFQEYSGGVTVSTQLFGKVKFKRKGLLGLKGLRHVVKPSVSLGYRPDYQSQRDWISNTPYYITADQLQPVDVATGVYDSLSNQNQTLFSPFEGQIFGRPPNSTQGMSASYSISNLIEAKVWNKKDSTDQNIKLFQNLGVNGSYDFAADSLKWSPIRVGGSTQFFKGVTRVSIRGVFDPYRTRRVIDPKTLRSRATRLNTSVLSEGGFPAELTDFNATFSTNVTVQKIRELFQGEEEEVVTDIREERRKRREEESTLFEETDLLSLFEKFSIVHTFSVQGQRVDQENSTDTRTVRGVSDDPFAFNVRTNTISLRGSINLTENWTVNIGQIGYDFRNKTITYPYLNFTRDLHCWEMNFGWAPQRNVYQFSIAVKPGTLDFLKVPVNRNRYDTSNF